MKIIKPSVEILGNYNGIEILKAIEVAGRTCYKSEDRITDESASDFVKMILQRGHEAMIEHQSITVKFICDRGVSHEIVRHRIAAYAQESTRYCNYAHDKFGNEIAVIEPFGLTEVQRAHWYNACRCSETLYFCMLEDGCTPQIARSVLPNSLKTEIVVTYNLREWRHFFALRAVSPAAHPQMREVAFMALEQLSAIVPIVFDDLMDQAFKN